MIVNIFIINVSTISFIHICNMNDINNIYMAIIMALPLSYTIYILLISFMLQKWMKLMVVMLMMNMLTIMTMMMILMMILDDDTDDGTYIIL